MVEEQEDEVNGNECRGDNIGVWNEIGVVKCGSGEEIQCRKRGKDGNGGEDWEM